MIAELIRRQYDGNFKQLSRLINFLFVSILGWVQVGTYLLMYFKLVHLFSKIIHSKTWSVIENNVFKHSISWFLVYDKDHFQEKTKTSN